MKHAIALCFLCCVAFITYAQTDSFPGLSKIVAPGAQLKKLPQEFAFTEGASTDRDGNIYFTDQPNDQIWKYDVNGNLSLFMEKAGRANGTFFSHAGTLVTCSEANNEIWSIDPKKKITKTIVTSAEGKKFNGPNDLWLDGQDDIYFTDPYYQRDFWTRKQPDLAVQGLYFVKKGTNKAKLIDSTLQQPNGIVGSKDGKVLFVSDIKGGKTYIYDIGRNGVIANRRLFVAQGSDGIVLDANGNVYLTGSGVTVYNPHGELIGRIPLPGWTGNLCFGGKDKKMLLITSSKSVYTLKMQVSGIE